MSDEITDYPLSNDMNLIINLKNSDANKGSHWVLFVKRGIQCIYMDSFGAFPDTHTVDYCEKHGLKLAYNGFIIQHLESTQCGLFCFSLLVHLKKAKINHIFPREFESDLLEKVNDWVNTFVSDTSQNDAILGEILP